MAIENANDLKAQLEADDEIQFPDQFRFDDVYKMYMALKENENIASASTEETDYVKEILTDYIEAELTRSGLSTEESKETDFNGDLYKCEKYFTNEEDSISSAVQSADTADEIINRVRKAVTDANSTLKRTETGKSVLIGLSDNETEIDETVAQTYSDIITADKVMQFPNAKNSHDQKESETPEPQEDHHKLETPNDDNRDNEPVSENDEPVSETELNEAMKDFKIKYNNYMANCKKYIDSNQKSGEPTDQTIGRKTYTANTDDREELDKQFKELYQESERIYQMSKDVFDKNQKEIQDRLKEEEKEQPVDAEYKTVNDDKKTQESFAEKIRERGQEKSQRYNEKIQKYHEQAEARKDYSNKYNEADLNYQNTKAGRLATKAQRLNSKRTDLKNAHGLNRLRKLEVNIHAAEVNWRATRASKKVKKIRRKQLRAQERYQYAKEREERATRRKERAEYFSEKEAQAVESVSNFGRNMSEKARKAYYNVYANSGNVTNNYRRDMQEYYTRRARSYGPKSSDEEIDTYGRHVQSEWEQTRQNIENNNDKSRTVAVFETMTSNNLSHPFEPTSLRKEGEFLAKHEQINGLSHEEYDEISKAGQKLAESCSEPEDYLEALDGIMAFEEGAKKGIEESADSYDSEALTKSNMKQIVYRMADPVLQQVAEHWDEFPETIQNIIKEYPSDGAVSSIEDYKNGLQEAPTEEIYGFADDSMAQTILAAAARLDAEDASATVEEQTPETTKPTEKPEEKAEENPEKKPDRLYGDGSYGTRKGKTEALKETIDENGKSAKDEERQA